MDEEKFSAFPYITRKMLAFESGVSFDLEVVTASKSITAIEITGMTREGLFKYSLKTNGSTVAETTIFRIPDVPIFLTVKTAAVAASVNIVYAMIYLRANQTRVQLLCQGSLGQLHGINFPNQVVASPLQQKGISIGVSGANPAAGAEFSITVPAGQYWLLKQVACTLITDATVANRRVNLYLQDPSGYATKIAVTINHTASLTMQYHWFHGTTFTSDGTGQVVNMPLPKDLILAPGYSIGSVTTLLQAADDFGVPRAYVEIFYSD